VPAIEFFHRTNLVCVAPFELVKLNKKRPPIFVPSTSSAILEFQPNQLAFCTFQQLEPMQKDTIAPAIEFFHRTNLVCIMAFELVK
jgi:hypothetical protein